MKSPANVVRRCRAGRLAVGAALLLVWAGGGPGPLLAADSPVHEPLRLRRGRIVAGHRSQARVVDDPGAYCLECHGEATTSPAGADLGAAGRRPIGAIGHPDQSHPVEVPYPLADPDYVPRGDLDRRLVLVDGRLSCVTCHDAESPDHALVMPTGTHEGLCTACHRK